MRIALLMHSVLPRGGVVHTLELADAMHARGHQVTVIAPAEGGQRLFRETAARVALLPAPAVRGPLVEQVRQRIEALVAGLPAVLDVAPFDLLHAQDSLNGNALATLDARGALHAPWVRTVHHLDAFEAPELRAWQQRGWAAAHAIGCVSATWCAHFEHLGRPARRLFNGVNLARFGARGPRVVLDGGGAYVLALGGVEARKNSVRLLQAFAQVRDAEPALRLMIAGGASLLDHGRAAAEWQAALRDSGLSEERVACGPLTLRANAPVIRLGPVPDAAVPPLLRGARVLAMPSLVEGFGLVALEALACGTPALVSARAPFTEHLPGTRSVAWCDPESVASIATGLREALALPRPSEPPAVCAALSWERSAAGHEAWYADVLHDARVSAALVV